ncbi:MAG: SRPBCC domain-containing protein [Rhodothermales bacterium]
MPDIYHDFPVVASPEEVFKAISSSEGLNAWWTKQSAGLPETGTVYQFWFAPEYDWRGRVSECKLNSILEWEITVADADWAGTRVGFELISKEGYTQVRFHHTGWKTVNDEFRGSSYCWAMYLRVMKAYVEDGKMVFYEDRQNPSI